MIPFKKFLEEARSNPELNPKVSVYEYLKKYKKDPTIYISFTDDLSVDPTFPDDAPKSRIKDSKIGVNPKSNYATPLGVYSYPLKEVWEEYNIDSKKSLRGLPFAADRPFVYVLQAKEDGFVNNMYSDYTNKNYDEDYRKLKEIFLKFCDHFDAAPTIYYRMCKSLVYDDGMQTAFREEYSEKINKLSPELEQKFYGDCWIVFINYCLRVRQESNPIMAFWMMSKVLAEIMSGKMEGNSHSIKWNWILRKCGYSGFADKKGRGYIHPSEPIQAVFLSRDAFTVLDRVENKDYATKPIESLSDICDVLSKNPTFALAVINFLVTGTNINIYNSHNLKFTKTNDYMIDHANLWEIYELFLLLKSPSISKGDKPWIVKSCYQIIEMYGEKHDIGPDEMDEVNKKISDIYHL